jgi:outer membrane receptor protein involved in Fe transport
VIWAATTGLTLQAGGSINNAEYKDSVPTAGVVEGSRIGGVPKTTWNASATYERPFTSTLSAYARAGVQHISERPAAPSGSFGGAPSDAVTSVDVRLGLQAEHWGAFVFADNLTNEDGAIAEIPSTSGGEAARYRPRTVGLNLRVSF